MGAIVNGYASLDEARSYLNEQSGVTGDDTEIEVAIAAASRRCDNSAGGRRFYVKTETLTLTAECSTLLRLRDDERVYDLLSLTSLKTDEDDDRTYEVTWDSSDYDLEPINSTPKYQIRTRNTGDYTFPLARHSVQVAGRWGYSEDTESVGTLDAAIADTTTTTVTMVAGHSVSVGDRLLIDTEQILVTAVVTNTLTVQRGINGTTAATHADEATVSRYIAPPSVRQACLIEMGRIFKRREAPFGIESNPEFGGSRIPVQDPDARMLMNEFRLVKVR